MTLFLVQVFGYMDAMRKVAEEFPDVKFEHATGYKSNDTNFANYGLRLYPSKTRTRYYCWYDDKKQTRFVMLVIHLQKLTGETNTYTWVLRR